MTEIIIACCENKKAPQPVVEGLFKLSF